MPGSPIRREKKGTWSEQLLVSTDPTDSSSLASHEGQKSNHTERTFLWVSAKNWSQEQGVWKIPCSMDLGPGCICPFLPSLTNVHMEDVSGGWWEMDCLLFWSHCVTISIVMWLFSYTILMSQSSCWCLWIESSGLWWCYSLNVLKSILWCPYIQYDGIRRQGFWQVTGSWSRLLWM